MFKLSKLFKAVNKKDAREFNKFVLFDADKRAFIYTNAHILVALPACRVNINTDAVTRHLLIPFDAIQAADKSKVSILTDGGLKVDGAIYEVLQAERSDKYNNFVTRKIDDAGNEAIQFIYPNYEGVIPGTRTLSNSTPVHHIGMDIKYLRIISDFLESGIKKTLPVRFTFDSIARAVVLDCRMCLSEDSPELPFIMLMPVLVQD